MVAVNVKRAPGPRIVFAGATMTAVGPTAAPLMMAWAVADLVESAMLVAETETALGEGTALGAV